VAEVSPARQGPEDRAYLDHAATSPMGAAAVDAMMPFLDGRFGNPSGNHRESRRARIAVDDAREEVATLLGADLGEVVFTGSGTEGDNLAITGGWEAVAEGAPSPPAIICSSIEHHAVLHACRALARRTGADLREIPPDKHGIIDLDALAEACTPDVGLVSVMTVNNEIGTVQPMEAVASIVRDRSPVAVLHTDAVQAIPWLDGAVLWSEFDMVTLSAHKFGGPQGVGALVVRNGTGLSPVTHGGGQERDRRSGTHNVAGIVAMAAALRATTDDRPQTGSRVAALRDRLGNGLLASVPGAAETGERVDRVAGILHLRVSGVEGEALVVLLDEAGVAVSAGAACASGAVEASHVLVSMGMDPREASSGVRFSLGPTTTARDIDRALAAVPAAVAQLRD
jgi:cysteine desulfurase